MAWYDVSIGGITLTWVKPDIEIDREAHTIRIGAAAIYEYVGDDPVTEIASLNALSSGQISNEDLINGGTKLFCENELVVVINNETFSKCALHPITTPFDGFYNSESDGSVIEYELNLEYEADGRGGSVVYTPEYGKDEYAGELEYHHGYDPFSGAYWDYTDRLKGTEVGMCKFSMDKNVKRVEIYGNGDVTGSYLECNKTGRFYWPVGYLEQEGDYAPQQMGFGWDLDTKLTVAINADTMDTSIIVNSVRGGILDNTVLTLESGTGPETITLNDDHAHNVESLTVEAITDDITAGAVYGIDRRVVLVTSSPHLPDAAQFTVAGNASTGATVIQVTDPGWGCEGGRTLKRLSGTGPDTIVVDGDYTGGPTMNVESISGNVQAGAVYTMRLNMGTNMAYIRLVFE